MWRDRAMWAPFPRNTVEAALYEERLEAARERRRRVVRWIGYLVIGLLAAWVFLPGWGGE